MPIDVRVEEISAVEVSSTFNPSTGERSSFLLVFSDDNQNKITISLEGNSGIHTSGKLNAASKEILKWLAQI